MSAADCTPCSAGLHPPNQWPAALCHLRQWAMGLNSGSLPAWERRQDARGASAVSRRRSAGWRAGGPPFLALTHLSEDEVQRNKDCEPGNSGEKQVCDHEPPLEFPITLTFELAKMQGKGTRPRHYALRRRGNGMTLAWLSGSSGSQLDARRRCLRQKGNNSGFPVHYQPGLPESTERTKSPDRNLFDDGILNGNWICHVRNLVRRISKAKDYIDISTLYGGGSGIRTHGELAPTPVFKTGALNRSAIPPVTASHATALVCPAKACQPACVRACVPSRSRER